VRVGPRTALIVTADDYGYHPSYDRGIVEAAGAGALDAVSAMVLRDGLDPEALLGTGVAIGLHLELPREREGEDELPGGAVVAALREQLGRFEEIFGRPAAHLDGHHHCHARYGVAADVASEAAARGLPVRSVDEHHRALLRRLRVATPDRLVGRLSEEAEAALPPELRPAVEEGAGLPPGVTEWMVHPGHADPGTGSGYDQAREEDLDLLLSLSADPALSAARLPHAAALG
jgi:chitin disaccharide deacetylase